MKLSKEFKIGAIMLGAIAIAGFGINFLKGSSVFSTSDTFYGIYSEVSGLSIGNPVTVNGYKVGAVRDIALHNPSTGTLLVTFSVDDGDMEFFNDTQARIQSLDLLGSKTIALVLGSSGVPAESGDFLTVDIEEDLMASVNKQVGPIKLKAETLLSSIDSVMVITQALLQEDARPNLNKSFESIRRTLENLESTSSGLDGLLQNEKGRLGNILANLESITANFAQNDDQLGNLIQNFSDISDSLAQADIGRVVEDASIAVESIAEIMGQVNSGQGSLGLLLHNDSLYDNLTMASDNLDALLEDVRLNPKRYVNLSLFGKKDKAPTMTRKELDELKEQIKLEMREGR